MIAPPPPLNLPLPQGGVRTAAFVAGGLLPASVRGTVLPEMIHVCDWYRTFGVLAGVLPSTGALPGANYPGAQVPGVDSMDMWPLLSGQVRRSPRSGFALSTFAIIVGNHKYINGTVHGHESWNGKVCSASTCPGQPMRCSNPDCEMGQWTGPTWPVANCGGGGAPTERVCPHVCDASSNCTRNKPCSAGGCVFNLVDDPREEHDLSSEQPDLLASLQRALRNAVAARFQTNDSNYTYSGCAASWQENVAEHGNFAAPMCKIATPPADE